MADDTASNGTNRSPAKRDGAAAPPSQAEADAPANASPAPPPATTKPPFLKRLGTFASSWKGIASGSTIIGLAAVLAAWTQIYAFFVGPDLQVTFLKCEQRELVVRIDNKGGRPAMIDAPRFRIFAEGSSAPLRLTELEAPEPKGGTIPVDDPVDQRFPSGIDYFGPEMADAAGCRIEVTVPNNTDEPEIMRSCTCVYRR